MTIEIPLTQGKVALIDDEDLTLVSGRKWHAMKSRQAIYAATYDAPSQKHMKLHRLITNAPANLCVDHINGDALDNRRCNLRLCTNAENIRNQSRQKNNKSGYNGVIWDKSRNRWRAQIQANKKNVNLGMFVDIVDAARAYDMAAKRVFGEFARLNLG